MIGSFEAPVLVGCLVRLEPIGHHHAPDLAVAAEEGRSAYNFTWVPRAHEVDAFITSHLERADAGSFQPFAQIRLSDGRAIGCTAYLEPRVWPDTTRLRAVEIGFTWLSASAMGTGINADAKRLLFRHAFVKFGVARVDLKTDARNERSRRAMTAVGATFEGVLRNWSPSWAPNEHGKLRNSAMFSILAEEWPSREQFLEERIARARDRSSSV